MVGTRGSGKNRYWLRGKDSNLRPSGYEPDELPLLHPAKAFYCTRNRRFGQKPNVAGLESRPMSQRWVGPIRAFPGCAALVAMLAVAACGGTSATSGVPSGSTATASPGSPTSVAPTIAPPAAPVATAALPAARTLLVDTDVAPDDLVALAFLLRAPNVTVAAITVSGTGEARCAGGVVVVLSLLERLGAPSIPVACGRATPLAGDHAFPRPVARRRRRRLGSRTATDHAGRRRPRCGRAPPGHCRQQRWPVGADARSAHESRRSAPGRSRARRCARTRLRDGWRAPRPGQPGRPRCTERQ